MSVSIHCMALRDPQHEDFVKHMAVNEACLAAGIKKLPEETAAYFRTHYPECRGEMERIALEVERKNLPEGAISDLEQDYKTGFEINVSKLPADVKVVRVWMMS